MLEYNSIQISFQIIHDLKRDHIKTTLIRGVVIVEVVNAHVEKAFVLIPQFLQAVNKEDSNL